MSSNNWVWTNPNQSPSGIPYQSPPGINSQSFITTDSSLFDKEKYKLIDTSVEIVQPPKKCDHVGTACTMLVNMFKKNYCNLHMFLYVVRDTKKKCLQTISGFPFLFFDYKHFKEPGLKIRSHWYGAPFNQIGWQNVHDIDSIKIKNDDIKTEWSLLIKNIQKIKIYKWGFQILSSDDVNIFAAMSYVLKDFNVESTMYHDEWQFPLSDEVRQSANYMEIISEWQKQNNS